MTTSSDNVGDLLRDFYGTFGMPEEGPQPGLNVAATIGVDVPETELDVLRAALQDDVGRRQLCDCRATLEDLATRLTGKELLRELSGIPLPPGQGIRQLSSGVFWFALAATLDSRERGLPVTPLDGTIDLPLSVKVQMTVHGSLVLRLYVALVYMREGVLANLISESSRGGGQCSARVRKLFELRLRPPDPQRAVPWIILTMRRRDRLPRRSWRTRLNTWLLELAVHVVDAHTASSVGSCCPTAPCSITSACSGRRYTAPLMPSVRSNNTRGLESPDWGQVWKIHLFLNSSALARAKQESKSSRADSIS